MNSRYRATDNAFNRIENFRDSVREGPTHACICCHKTGYRTNFKQINFDDYKEEVDELKGFFFKDVVDESFKKKLEIPDWDQENDEDAKLHNICTTCDYYITKKKELPAMSYLNGLQLSKEFTPLGELETCLIAKNLVFQKIVRLPSSQWSALQGRTVNVPIDDEDILKTVDKLRTPANAGIIPVRLKRKKEYKSSHRQQYVNVKNVFKVLQDFKNAGHPDYQFVETYDEYKERCRKDDPEGHLFLFGDSTASAISASTLVCCSASSLAFASASASAIAFACASSSCLAFNSASSLAFASASNLAFSSASAFALASASASACNLAFSSAPM